MKHKKSVISLGIGSKNDNVKTPDWLFKVLNKEFDFDHDPCPLHGPENGSSNGLDPDLDWGARNFVNPPFSDIRSWLVKSCEQVKKGKLVALLLPARTSSSYWFEFVWPFASEIRFYQSYLTFPGYSHPLPIPWCLVVFRPGGGNLVASSSCELTCHSRDSLTWVSLTRSGTCPPTFFDEKEMQIRNLLGV